MSGLQGKIADAVKARGYQIMTSPDKAYYWIQANVLKADKMDLRESQGWLSRGYEGAAVGAALGGGITAYNTGSAGTTLGVGLATGLIGMAADAMVEDINYTMITDVQIAERTRTSVRTDNVAALRQGTSGSKIQTSTETGNQHKYQTRVVSSANQVNLKFEEVNRPGFPGECFICELRLPDHRFRWKHNKLFLLLPGEYGPAFPAIVDCYTSPPT